MNMMTTILRLNAMCFVQADFCNTLTFQFGVTECTVDDNLRITKQNLINKIYFLSAQSNDRAY